MKSIALNTIAQIFMMGCSLFAGVAGYSNRKKHGRNLSLLYIYSLASFVQMTFIYTIAKRLFPGKTKGLLIYYSDYIFLLIELFIIYHFFLNTLKTKSIKKILLCIQIAYALIIFYVWYKFFNSFSPPFEAYILQAFCILIPALFYFFELIKWPVVSKLTELPSFWASTGITIYFGSTMPLFLLKDFLLNKRGRMVEHDLYLINYIAYSIMFLFIAKAYLCPRKDTR